VDKGHYQGRSSALARTTYPDLPLTKEHKDAGRKSEVLFLFAHSPTRGRGAMPVISPRGTPPTQTISCLLFSYCSAVIAVAGVVVVFLNSKKEPHVGTVEYLLSFSCFWLGKHP
jgi:hypothetical protein